MKISAVFVVKKIAIEMIMKLNENKRMDYLLGLSVDQSFEDYIIDMDDFMETTEGIYSLIQKEYSYLFDLNMKNLYKEDGYGVYFLSVEELKKCDKLNNNLLSSQVKINSLNWSHTVTIKEKVERFIELILTAKDKQGDVILVFVK